MTTLASAWPALTGPRVEDFWVEVLDVTPGTGPRVNMVTGDSADFEGGTVGLWGANFFGSPAAVTIANSTTRAHGGSKSMRITYPNAAGGSGPQLGVQDFGGYSIGSQYTASAWVYVPTGVPHVVWGDPFGNTGTTRSTTNDAWERLTITWTAPTSQAFLVLRSSAATSGTEQVWVDDVEVVPGPANASEYTTEATRGALDGVTSCRVEYNVNATIRGGCSLTLRDTGQDLDWARVRLRPWVRVNDMTWPLGVYLPASPALRQDEHGSSWDVPCVDKMAVLDQDVVTATYAVPAGTVVTDEVAALIASTGESASALTPSDLTTRSPMTWEPGTTRLRIINDLLDSINYFSIWADRHGQYRAEPYRRPQDRALAATFASGESSILSPSWSREQDIAGVPNRVVLIVEGDDTNPGMVATADNTDPASPYSIPSRGVVARVYDNVEAADQATLDDLAVRYLADASTPSAALTVAHASVPLDGNAVVRFVDESIDTRAVVEGWSVDLAPGALMSGTWREVI